MFKKTKKLIFDNLFPLFWAFIFLSAISVVILPSVVEYSESPEFCSKCHSMKSQHLTWGNSRHRSLTCVDCHLPNDNIPEHFFWKGIDGTKDVVSQTLGLKEEDEIRLSSHGKSVLLRNCLRCHKETMSHVYSKRNCIDCHRSLTHKNTAAYCVGNTEVNNEVK